MIVRRVTLRRLIKLLITVFQTVLTARMSSIYFKLDTFYVQYVQSRIRDYNNGMMEIGIAY